MGLFSVIPALFKGIKNRDDQGGGIKGAFKAAAKGITGNDDLDLQKQINVNLEKIVENTTNKQPVKAGELPVPDVKQKRKNITSNTMIYQEQKFDPITGELITPMNNSAMLAGGSRPMAAMNDPYQTGQANMNPNFIGNYNGPTTGMLAQEKKMKDYLLTGVTVDADVETKNPMNVVGPNKDLANFKPTKVKPDRLNPGIEGEQSPESVVLNYEMGGPGVNAFNSAKLDERKRNSVIKSGMGANRDERFRDKLKKRSADLGVPDPVDSVLDQDRSDSTAMFMAGKAKGQFGNPIWKASSDSAKVNFPNIDADKIKSSDIYKPTNFAPSLDSPYSGVGDHLDVVNKRYGTGKSSNKAREKMSISSLPQDKAMPKGTAGKGIRGLAPSVQENMGYDPLSQERLTQSRRGTKCMRVKRK